jgi:hypothetical protein
MKLDPDDIERIAASVARRLTDGLHPDGERRFVDAATLARLLDVERDWIYRHAGELGGVRLGGPRGRLRFDLNALGDRLTPAAPGPSGRPARRAPPRRQPPGRAVRSSTTRPVGRRDSEPVRLLPYHVESPRQQHKSGRTTMEAPPGRTPGGTPDA